MVSRDFRTIGVEYPLHSGRMLTKTWVCLTDVVDEFLDLQFDVAAQPKIVFSSP